MSSYAALGHSTYVDDYDLTGDTNKTSLIITVEARDTTPMGRTVVARRREAGLEDVQSGASVFWEAGTGTVDPHTFANLTGRKVITMTPAEVEASRAYFFQAKDFKYEIGASIGETLLGGWAAQSARGPGTLSAGAIAGYLGKAKGTVSATGALGTAKQMGAVGASQYLYGALHLFGTAGTSITVLLESDDNALFSSATTRMTFGPLTAAGGTWGTRVAGAIADDYYRFRVSAITGTWTIAASFGIK